MKTLAKVVRDVSLIRRKSADGEDEICISTPNYDRGNDRVFPLGGQLENYLKNPVVMWCHDYHGMTPAAGIPVATCPYLKVTDEGIISGPPNFVENDPFATRVKNAWDQNIIRTASIGFQPIDYEENDRGGYDYKTWEMLEFSLCPIPMNAEAMRVAKSAGFEDLLAKPKTQTQGEIKDELDYTLSIIRAWNLNEENRSLAKSIHEELLTRFPAGDTAEEIERKALERLCNSIDKFKVR